MLECRLVLQYWARVATCARAAPTCTLGTPPPNCQNSKQRARAWGGHTGLRGLRGLCHSVCGLCGVSGLRGLLALSLVIWRRKITPRAKRSFSPPKNDTFRLECGRHPFRSFPRSAVPAPHPGWRARQGSQGPSGRGPPGEPPSASRAGCHRRAGFSAPFPSQKAARGSSAGPPGRAPPSRHPATDRAHSPPLEPHQQLSRFF